MTNTQAAFASILTLTACFAFTLNQLGGKVVAVECDQATQLCSATLVNR